MFVSHLEAAIDGTRLDAGVPQTMHGDRPLWVRYNMHAIGRAVTRDVLGAREPSLWRYRELLPVQEDENIVSLGEGMSPLLACPSLGDHLGLERVFIKDESQLPTGSFKARGLCMAVSMAKELGIRRLAIPTAGNAGGALAAYAARAGLECFVFMPRDTPVVNQMECVLFGARTFLVNGLITDCAGVIRAGAERMGWFDVSTLKEPYRIEGKKTMGLELAEQMGWELPAHIFYPTGGGTGLIGMWKAFGELGELGWLESRRMPRMHSCQASGCAPIACAFERGERFAEPPLNPRTVASGLRVPRAVGDFMILDAVRASGGSARSVTDDDLIEAMRLTSRLEGISLCPEAGACVASLARAVASGEVARDDPVVIFNTGAAQKYIEVLRCEIPSIDCRDVDWSVISG